jgi:hypothetical protein
MEKHARMTKITLVIEITITAAVSILIGYVAKNLLQQKMKEREDFLRKQNSNKYLQSVETVE